MFQERRQGQFLVVIDDAVFLQAVQNLLTALGHIAQREGAVHIQDIQCVAVLFVEGNPYQQLYTQTAAEGFSGLFLEPQADNVIVPGPASDTGTSHYVTALLVLLDHLTIEVSAEAYRGIGELSFNPVLLI